MKLRIIVPLKWDSELRIQLFNSLKQRGYHWSKGESLDTDSEKLHRMAYIAIYVNSNICKFSSNFNAVNKLCYGEAYNYIILHPTIKEVLSVLNYFNTLLSNSEYNKNKVFNMLQDSYSLNANVL